MRPHATAPQHPAMSRLWLHGYDSNAKGMKAVFPGATDTVSTPANKRNGQTRSRPKDAATRLDRGCFWLDHLRGKRYSKVSDEHDFSPLRQPNYNYPQASITNKCCC